MILTEVKVHNLFGELDHTLTFNDSRRITYIIGRNGTGKTTVLQMIDAIAKGDWWPFIDIQFDDIQLTLKTDSEISLTISKDSVDELPENCLHLKYTVDEETKIDELIQVKGFNKQTATGAIKRLIQNKTIRELSCGHWASEYRSHMTIDEVLSEYGHEIILINLPNEIKHLFQSWHTTFLSADRHIAEEEPHPTGKNRHQIQKCYVVDKIAEDITKRLKDAQGHFLEELEKISDDLEKSLLSQGLEHFEKVDDTSFGKLYREYLRYRERLEKVDLSGGTTIEYHANGSRNDMEKALIAHIIRQRIKAYKPYEEMLHSLELFNELLTATLTRKTVKASLPDGIHIKTDSGKTFPPVQLSSGEQQVVILAHTLLFNMPNDSLALIDEPELSMDVEWQSNLSNWLERVGEEKNLQFILATHSPLLFIGRSKEAIQTFTP